MARGDLAKKRCIPCEEGGIPLSPKEARELLTEIDSEWILIDDARLLAKSFKFKDFAQTMKFANEVARIAEEEGHHPDMTISYNMLGIELTTHAMEGLSENDFILASKIDRIKI